MYKLDKIDIGWIFAVKHNKETEYYREHYAYGGKDFVPNKSLLGQVVMQTLIDADQLGKAMRFLSMDMSLYEMLENRKTFTYYEIIYFAFKTWAFNLSISDLEELADLDWRSILNEMKELEDEGSE